MPFVPFKKKSASQASDDASSVSAAPTFSKQFGKKKRQGKRAPAQKALTAPGRSMSGGGR